MSVREGPSRAPLDPRALAARIEGSSVGERSIVGIAGPPGTGKSTLAAGIVAELRPGTRSAIVSMDGYHLSNEVLRTLGREGRKGAIDTFDAEGFAVLLERLRARTGETVYAPHFDHGVGEPIAASVAIPASVDIVLVDGNYLLADGPEWERARAVMDEVWYLETPHDIRLERLIARHVATGKSPEMAIAWANGSDQDNARLIAATAARAQLIVEG